MRLKSPILVLFVVSAALSGCISAYTLPAGASVAKARFQTVTPNVPMLFVRTQAMGEMRCQQIGQLGVPEVSQLDMLDGSKAALSDRIERAIQADAPFLVYFQQVGGEGAGGGSCQVPVVFTPRASGEYELTHAWNHVQRKCFVRIDELTRGDDGKTVRTPIMPSQQEKVRCL